MLKPLASDRPLNPSSLSKSPLAARNLGCWRILSLLLWALLGAASRTAVAQANEWTWMGGSNMIDCLLPNGNYGEAGADGMLVVRSAANIPEGRYGAAIWTDKEGNFWIFGGDSNSSGSDGQNNLKRHQ